MQCAQKTRLWIPLSKCGSWTAIVIHNRVNQTRVITQGTHQPTGCKITLQKEILLQTDSTTVLKYVFIFVAHRSNFPSASFRHALSVMDLMGLYCTQ